MKRAEIHQGRFLSDATRALAASLDYEQTLQRVAEMAVPEFADWCTVSMPRRDGVMEPVAIAHADPGRVQLARRLSDEYPSRVEDPGAGEVVRTRKPQLIEIPDEMLREHTRSDEHYELIAGLGLRSAIIVPVEAGDEVSSAITSPPPSPDGSSTSTTSRSARSWRGGPGSRSRTRASSSSARRSPTPSRRPWSPRACRTSRAGSSPPSTAPRRRGRRSGGTSTTPSRCRAGGCS